jgi:DNA-binding NarL/FixJ family response regulator
MDGVTGRRGPVVLLAQSEAIIALGLASTLQELGCRVLGPARSAREALALVHRQRPDLALLDAKLADGSAAPLAKALRAGRVPFALVTAHDPASFAESVLRAAPCLGLPYLPEELESMLLRLVAARQQAGRSSHAGNTAVGC